MEIKSQQEIFNILMDLLDGSNIAYSTGVFFDGDFRENRHLDDQTHSMYGLRREKFDVTYDLDGNRLMAKTTPLFLRLGDSYICNGILKEKNISLHCGIPEKNLIFLSQPEISYGQQPNNVYAALTSIALSRLQFDSPAIVDLGCGDMNQSLVILKKSPNSVALGIESPEESKFDFDTTVRKNLELNEIDPNRANMQKVDLRNLSPDKLLEIMKLQFGREPDVAIANIGPHYGEVDMKAAELIVNTPSIKTAILGGYSMKHPELFPFNIIEILRKKFEKFEFIQLPDGRCSIICT